jgi:ribonuclease PH
MPPCVYSITSLLGTLVRKLNHKSQSVSDAVVAVLQSELSRLVPTLQALDAAQSLARQALAPTRALRLIAGPVMLSSLPAASYPEASEDERGCGFAVSFWLYLPSLVSPEAGSSTSTTAASTGTAVTASTASTAAATAGTGSEAASGSEWRICCRQVESFNTDSETDDANSSGNNNSSSSSSSSSCHPDVRLTDTPEHGLQIQFSVISRGSSSNSTAVTATTAAAATAATVAGGGQHSYTAHKLTSTCGLPRDEWVHVCCGYDSAPATAATAAATVDSNSATNASDAATARAAHSMSLCINGATVAQHSVSTEVPASSANSSAGSSASTVYQPIQCCSLQTGSSATTMNVTNSAATASSCTPMLCDLSWHSRKVSVAQVKEVAVAGPVGVRATEVTTAQCYCSRLSMLALSLAHRNSSSDNSTHSSSISSNSYYRSPEWLTLWLQLLPLAGAYAQRCIVSLLQQRLLEHTSDANMAGSEEAASSSTREDTVRTLCELLGKRVLRFAYEDSAAVCDDVYLSSSSSSSSYSKSSLHASSTAAAAAQQQHGFCLTSELTSLLRGLLALPATSLWHSAASSVLQGAVNCSKLGAADGYTTVGHAALPLACAAVYIAGGQVPVLCTGALVAVPADSCTALQCCAVGSVQHFYAGAELPVSAAVALHDSSCIRDAVHGQTAAQPLSGSTSTDSTAAAADTATAVVMTLPVDTLVLTTAAAAPLPPAPYVHTVSALQLLTGLLQSYPALPRSAHSSVSPLRAAGSAALSPPARSLAAAAVATLDDALAASHLRTRLLRALTAQLSSARATATASSDGSCSGSAHAAAAAVAAAAAAVVHSTDLLHALLLLAVSDVAAAPTAALRGDAGAAAALMPAVAAFGAALSAGGVHGVCGAAALQQASQVTTMHHTV